MTKKFEDFKRVNQFDLPETIDPERICVCFEIPNERYHIRAFWTALYRLTLWNSWAADEAHTAREVAAVWRDVWNTAIKDEDTMGCGCSDRPTQRRLSPSGILEVSYDDGQTWEEDRANDPRFSNPVLPPLTGGTAEEKRCTMANSIVTALEAEQQKQLDILQDQAQLATAIFDSIAAFLAIVGATGVGALFALISLLIGLLVRTIINMLPEDFEAQFNLTTWQALLCILYCEIDDNGHITEAAWQNIKTRCISEVPTSYAGHWCSDMINAMGVVGLTNAGLGGWGGARDCSNCECDDTWCYLFDFEQNNGGFSAQTTNNPFSRNLGTYVSGSGWRHTDVSGAAQIGGTVYRRGVYIQRDFTMATVTKITVAYEYTEGTFIPANQYSKWQLESQSGVIQGGVSADVPPPTPSVWEGNISMSRVRIMLTASGRQNVSGFDGSALIKWVKLEGTGSNPFGADNCP